MHTLSFASSLSVRSHAVITTKARPKHVPQCSTTQPQTPESALISWCTTRNISFPNLTICTTDKHRGLQATTQITPQTTLLTVPRTAALIADTTDPNPPPFQTFTPSRSFWQKAPWYVRLALIVLDEKRRIDSPFATYIAALPKDPWCALWASQTLPREQWTPQLKRFRLLQMADRYRKYIKSIHVALHASVPDVSLREFCWALSIAESRAFGIPPAGTPLGKNGEEPVQYAIFPLLDMANHSVHCSTSFKYEMERDVYVVKTGVGFERGEEVLVSYGDRGNEEWIMFYGFVEGENPADVVRVPEFREWILELGEVEWERKLALLRELLKEGRGFVLRKDGLDEALMRVLRIAVATEEEVSVMERGGKVGLENELRAWEALEELCDKLLEEVGEFDAGEQKRLEAMFGGRLCSAMWDWKEQGSDGELLYRYERQNVLARTLERVRHFAKVSRAVGRVCTVLMPPGQSLLKTTLWEGEEGTAAVHRFAISPEDLKV